MWVLPAMCLWHDRGTQPCVQGLCQAEEVRTCSAVIMVGTKAFLSLRTVSDCSTLTEASFSAKSLHVHRGRGMQ